MLQNCHLPITLPLLLCLQPLSITRPGVSSYEELLLWATATMCFFGFFRAGKLMVFSPSAYNSAAHLSWGDVSISEDGRMLQVFLKRSKTNQYGRGIDVFIGSTSDALYPIDAMHTYATRHSSAAGAFFCSEGGVPLAKPRFVEMVRAALTCAGVSTIGYSGHTVASVFHNTGAQSMGEFGVHDVYSDTKGIFSTFFLDSNSAYIAEY